MPSWSATCVSDKRRSMVHLLHTQRPQDSDVLAFMPIGITTDHNSLVKVYQLSDVIPVLMSMGLKFLVPIKYDEMDTMIANFNNGLDHPRHGFVPL